MGWFIRKCGFIIRDWHRTFRAHYAWLDFLSPDTWGLLYIIYWNVEKEKLMAIQKNEATSNIILHQVRHIIFVLKHRYQSRFS